MEYAAIVFLLGSALLLLIAASFIDPMEFLAQAQVPDLLLLPSLQTHNLSSVLLSVPHPIRPNRTEFLALSAEFQVERSRFWLNAFGSLGLMSLLAGTLVMRLPARRSVGLVTLSEPLVLIGVTSLFQVTFSLKILLAYAGSENVSPHWGLDYEGCFLFFLVAFLWLFLQLAVVCRLKPSVSWDTGAFPRAVLACMAPFVSRNFDTMKDAQLLALALLSTSVLKNAVGAVSCVVFLLFHLHAVTTPRLRVELGQALLPLVLALPPGEPPHKLSLLGRMLWPLYTQTRPLKSAFLWASDMPQALLALVLIWAAPQHLQPVVLVLNIGAPLAKLLFATAARPILAPVVVGQLVQHLSRALDWQQPEEAAEWLEELGYVYESHPDLVRKEISRATFSVTEYELWESRISDPAATVLGLVIEHAPNFKELVLSHNHSIGTSGAVGLAAGIGLSRSLTKVHVRWQLFQDEGAIAFAAAMAACPTLLELDLQANWFGIEGESALHSANQRGVKLFLEGFGH